MKATTELGKFLQETIGLNGPQSFFCAFVLIYMTVTLFKIFSLGTEVKILNIRLDNDFNTLNTKIDNKIKELKTDMDNRFDKLENNDIYHVNMSINILARAMERHGIIDIENLTIIKELNRNA